MKKNDQKWVAAYYPFDMVRNQHSRTIICLLFDKIICHFPVSSMACGGGHGMSENCYGDDPLVKAGIIELREETLLDEIHVDFSPGHFWGTDEEFDIYHRLQITGMSLNECVSSGSVPLTDIPESPIPATIIENFDLKRFARLQASALAIQSLRISLPPLKKISDLEILEARDQLQEQLIPFRHAMLSLSPLVRQGIEDDIALPVIHKEAQYTAETRILPALSELRKKLKSEKGKFWRRIILKGSSIFPSFLFNWTTKNALTAAIGAIDLSKTIALDLIKREETLESLKVQAGLGYLLEIVDHPIFKEK